MTDEQFVTWQFIPNDIALVIQLPYNLLFRLDEADMVSLSHKERVLARAMLTHALERLS
jgi:hypothetical protein